MTLLAEAPLASQSSGSQPTLAALTEALWRELTSGLTAQCPICHGEMEPEYAQHARPVRGRCNECGSVLA